ncbi:MAG: CHAP domain-containing protein [Myxococcaceae bacterium]|jgi:hypothetical protein|nr:CHAP domain-containing protein [Myxococcaceae bacterium]MCA3013041.1 CHAP domain-containing protein [Myxococcaceae bacterium]
MNRLAALGLSLTLTACATGRPLGARASADDDFRPFGASTGGGALPSPPEPGPALALGRGARGALVERARALVGARDVQLDGRRFGDDCTSLVRGLFASLGVDVMRDGLPGDNGVTAIWRFAARRGRLYEGGRPVPGDLVFFRETYDRNRDGLENDGLTHVGVVGEVDADGTVSVIHRVARGVVRYRMNLAVPTVAKDATGRTLNDSLRQPGTGARARLTGELFATYATLLPLEDALTRR